MKKIVVTGATSMIGIALIEEAIKQKVQVLAIIRKNSTRVNRLPNSQYIKTIACDIEHLDELPNTVEQYDVFYHFAWNYTNKEGRNNPMFQANNILTTLDAVNLAKRLGCRTFVGAGSQAEYGMVDAVISSDTHTNPDTPYGIAKLAAGKLAEELCKQYSIKFIWGRIFSVYGRYDNEWTMIMQSLKHLIQHEPVHFSSGTQMWNYLNEHDAGKAFYLLGEKDYTNGIYCIAHPDSCILKNYIQKLIALFPDADQYTFEVNNPNRKLLGIQADIKKLVQDTGFAPKISFEDGILEIIEFLKSQM